MVESKVFMADGIGTTLKRFVLWDYPRSSWQYEVMVSLILVFIFFTPKEVFRDQPRPKNVVMVSEGTFLIDTELLAGKEGAALERRPPRSSKRKPVQRNGLSSASNPFTTTRRTPAGFWHIRNPRGSRRT